MPIYFQRPENALKRANEFIDVGKSQRALDALYDVIKSKKHRSWQKIHEPIMAKYLELCVDLKKSHIAKEGLYQYKNICQQVNIKSLEDVVRKYLSMAEERTEAARKESHQTVVDVDDLDVIQTPENLLLSAVSGEDTQDRTDRAILTPWVKFLWESYRQCLDLLRNNSSVEKLYQDIAQQAFKFCLKYNRKTEFRKLSDNLRTHLQHVYKHQHQQRAINLNNPDSQAMHLETRLAQLDSAIKMELWQEAFKAVEDIHGLIALSKKSPKPSLMANYYQKVGLVFWKSGNHMFHACAWHRLYTLSREQRKNLSQDELQRLSSRVLCATLAVPITPARSPLDQLLEVEDSTVDKQRRLANLLGLQHLPTRSQLVKDMVTKFNVVPSVHPELQNLYKCLEVEYNPLTLWNRLESSMLFIEKNDELSQYVPALQDIAITRLVKQVSQIYQTIEFTRLCEMLPFANPFHVENIIVQAARGLDLQIRINHQTRSISFGSDPCLISSEESNEGPFLQSMPSENIRNQLSAIAVVLEKAMSIIDKDSQSAEREKLRQNIIHSYRQTARKEHARILLRRQIIEDRKEELENITVQREQQEQHVLEEERRKQYQAEMARLEREAKQREEQRRQREHDEIQRKAAKERLDQLRSTPLGAKVFADMDENVIAGLDADEIVARQVEQLEKEKRELQEKLRQQERKVDFFERAKRQEEIPLLEKQAEEEAIVAKQFWEDQENQKIEQMKAERLVALEQRNRLSKLMEDKDAFVAQLTQSRKSIYQEKLADFERQLNDERKKRLLERKERRKEERRTRFFKEREEEEQRKRDEELKRQREEEERLEDERREAERKQYEEKLRKLEEQAEKQRQREAEIEEKEKKRREEQNALREKERDVGRDRKWGDEAERPERVAWRPGGGGGGWRERERAREDRWSKPGENTEERFNKTEDQREDDRWGGRRDDRRDMGRREDRDDKWRRDGPPRDDDRWRRDGPPRGERGAWGRDDNRDDRFRRDDRDDRFRRDDRDDRFRRDDRDDRFRRDDREDRFRRDDRDDRFRRDDRREDFRDSPRDMGRRDGGGWRDRQRDEGRRFRDDDNRDDRWGSDRRGPAREEPQREWRRGGERPDVRSSPGKPPEEKRSEDDGWTTVRH